MATFSSLEKTFGDSATLLPIIGTIDIDSVPPASMRSALPSRIWSVSMPGACATTLRRTCASMSSGRVLRKTPRGALPTGVRVAATMYASCICLVMESVPERLAGLQHVRDAFLGLGHLRERDEVFAFQAQQPRLVDERTAVHFAAAQHGGDARGDLVVVRRDEAAFEHVDQQHLERRDAHVARDLDAACSSSKALKTTMSWSRASLSCFASNAEVDTLPIATLSNAVLSWANTSPPGPAASDARSASSFRPPPAGNKPTPASTRPI